MYFYMPGEKRIACIKNGKIDNIVIAESVEQLYELFPTMWEEYIEDKNSEWGIGLEYKDGKVIVPPTSEEPPQGDPNDPIQ